MTQEIALHRSLSHHNIVKFHSNFSTELFVIITLELCSRRSLMELHKRRGKILEPECRYYSVVLLKCRILIENSVFGLKTDIFESKQVILGYFRGEQVISGSKMVILAIFVTFSKTPCTSAKFKPASLTYTIAG